MFQVLYQRLADQNEVQVEQMMTMIGAELQQNNNLIVKKRAIELLVRLSDFDSV